MTCGPAADRQNGAVLLPPLLTVSVLVLTAACSSGGPSSSRPVGPIPTLGVEHPSPGPCAELDVTVASVTACSQAKVDLLNQRIDKAVAALVAKNSAGAADVVAQQRAFLRERTSTCDAEAKGLSARLAEVTTLRCQVDLELTRANALETQLRAR